MGASGCRGAGGSAGGMCRWCAILIMASYYNNKKDGRQTDRRTELKEYEVAEQRVPAT